MAQEIAGIRPSDYAALKGTGKVRLLKIGDATVLLSQQLYDPKTGAPGAPVTVQFNLGNIAEMRANLHSQRDALDMELAGLDALEVDVAAALA